MKHMVFSVKRPLSLLLIFFLNFTNGYCEDSQAQDKKTNYTQQWKVIGPGGGGGIPGLTISPHDSRHIFAYCDMTAAYVSYNGGKKWRMFNLWTVPTNFEFDPRDPDTVYASTRGYLHNDDRGSGLSLLYRSENRGKTWRVVYPDVEKAKPVEKLQSSTLLPSEIVSGSFNGTIEKLKIDPANSKNIFLGMVPLKPYIGGGITKSGLKSAVLIFSKDRGYTWNRLVSLPGNRVLAIFPGRKGRKGEVTVFTEKACIHINITTGKIVHSPLPAEEVVAVSGGTGVSGSIIYILSPIKKSGRNITGGIYRSDDWGENWTQVNPELIKKISGGELPELICFGVCATAPEVVYLSSVSPVPRFFRTTEWRHTIYKTESAGSNWKPVLVSNDDGFLSKNYVGGWLDRTYGPGWGGSPKGLSVAPSDPDICFAMDNGRVYQTSDGGITWEQIYSKELPDGSSTSRGLDTTTCYGVHFDPFDKNHFFITYTDIGLFHTFNGGQSWFHSLDGIPKDWRNTCYWLEFDPLVKDRVWSAWGRVHDLPRDKMFRSSNGFGWATGGVAVSGNGGRSWQKKNRGLPKNSICTHILIDPDSSVNSRVLYVSVFDKGVYKSIDGGRSWQESSQGIGKNRFAWQIRRRSDGLLFLLTTRGRKSGRTVDGRLYVSSNNASSWQPMLLPDGVNAPHDLQIDPINPQRMYLSCWTRTVDGRDRFGGVYRTEDGGSSWKQIFDERIRVSSAAIDPRTPDTVYINTFHNAAFRSENRGISWKRLAGYRFKWGQRVIPDPRNQKMVFLTTYGGSVFHGPAAGTITGIKDIENLPDSWW